MKKIDWSVHWKMEWQWDYEMGKSRLYIILTFYEKRAKPPRGVFITYGSTIEHHYVLVHNDETDDFDDVSLTYNGNTYLSTHEQPLPYPDIRKHIWHGIRLEVVTKGETPTQPLFCECCGLKQTENELIDVDFQTEFLGKTEVGNPCYFCLHEEWHPNLFQETVCRKRNITKVNELVYDEFVTYSILVQQMGRAKEGRDKNKKA